MFSQQGLVKVENLTRDPSKGKKVICDYQEDDVIRGNICIRDDFLTFVAIIIGNENEYVLLSFCADENLDLKLVIQTFSFKLFLNCATGLR